MNHAVAWQALVPSQEGGGGWLDNEATLANMAGVVLSPRYDYLRRRMGEVLGEKEENTTMMLTGNQPAEIFSSSSAFATHFKFITGVGEGKSMQGKQVKHDKKKWLRVNRERAREYMAQVT